MSSLLKRSWTGWMSQTRKTNREGAILGLVLVTMVILSFLGIGLINLSLASALEAGRTVSTVQSFWNAEAGLEQAKAIAQKRRRPANLIVLPGSPSGFLTGTNSISGATTSGTYSVDVYADPTWTNVSSNLKRYIIRSRGRTPNGKEQTVMVSALIESFASYMHASNAEETSGGNNIYFATGDLLDGPVYVNDQLNISGTPRFLKSVSSADSTVNYRSGGTAAVFEGGLNLGVPPLDISGQFSSGHIGDIKDEANSGGLALTGDYRFEFVSDGSFNYTELSTGITNTSYLSSLNGAIYVDGDVHVNGVVNGQVTLAAQEAIFITSGVRYASAISPNPWATNFNPSAVTDMLGLVASNQVQIVGTNAITLHAAILVTNDGGGFNAERYTSAFGKPAINLYGSLSQYRRGAVGQVGANGYTKNYKYDSRYYTDSPPNFPYSSYTFSQWRHSGI